MHITVLLCELCIAVRTNYLWFCLNAGEVTRNGSLKDVMRHIDHAIDISHCPPSMYILTVQGISENFAEVVLIR